MMSDNRDWVNIPRDVEDDHHRYTMPKMVAKVEGRGNGIKTVIVNMSTVAKCLMRPPEYVTKFFGFELGAITKCDEAHDRYVVNGSHDLEILDGILDQFIEKFLLCKADRNPETRIKIKGSDIRLVCKACGESTQVDTTHRLSTFIVKHPPPTEDNYSRPNAGEPSSEFAADDSNGEVIWFSDTSTDSVKKRFEKMMGVERDEVIDSFKKFLEASPSNEEIEKEINRVTLETKWEGRELISFLFEGFFDKDIRKQVKKFAQVILKFVKKPEQKIVLGCMEELVNREKSLLPAVPHILKELYDADLAEEDAILLWDQKVTKQYVDKETAKSIRVKAQPFINWLKSADEESDEE